MKEVWLGNKARGICYFSETGVYDFWQENICVLSNLAWQVTIVTDHNHPQVVSSLNYLACHIDQEPAILRVTWKAPDLPEIVQIFKLEEAQGIRLQVFIKSNQFSSIKGVMGIKSISPLKTTTASAILENQAQNFLSIPYDNDDWVRYSYKEITHSRESYDVGVVVSKKQHFLVLGATQHDLWKNVVKIGEKGEPKALEVICGYTSPLTRDQLPHGVVQGEEISSDVIYLAYGEDFTQIMENFAKACNGYRPHLKWEKPVPIGWNSFSAFPLNVSLEDFKAASDFLDSVSGIENQTYINFDYLHQFDFATLPEAVNYAKQRGQNAGFYFVPFAIRNEAEARKKKIGEDTDICFEDLLLRDGEGNILSPVDELLSLDPTHPENIARGQKYLEKFLNLGYRYVKLDFLAHGAREGNFYVKEITTGRQAYNYGMKQILDFLKQTNPLDLPFISASIAPLFPIGYAHGRRISCDCFGRLEDTEYMLQSLSWSYWMNGRLYALNDPDHTVLYESFKHSATTEEEAQSRFLASVIAGTVFMLSDDYQNPVVRQRARKLMENETIQSLIKSKQSFQPLRFPTPDKTCEIYFLRWNSRLFVCLFNFSLVEKLQHTVDFKKLGSFNMGTIVDVCSGQQTQAVDSIEIKLDPGASCLVEIINMA